PVPVVATLMSTVPLPTTSVSAVRVPVLVTVPDPPLTGTLKAPVPSRYLVASAGSATLVRFLLASVRVTAEAVRLLALNPYALTVPVVFPTGAPLESPARPVSSRVWTEPSTVAIRPNDGPPALR